MGNSFISKVQLKKTITGDEFRAICNNYSKTFISYEEAKDFIRTLAISVEEDNITDEVIMDLIDSVDGDQLGYLTAVQFKHLFYDSARLLPLRWTASVQPQLNQVSSKKFDSGKKTNPPSCC